MFGWQGENKLVSYQQIDQFGIKQIVKHERETTSSGRPKPKGCSGEDQFFFYSGDRNCSAKSLKKEPKNPLQQFAYWHDHEIQYSNGRRITPLTEFEKQMGVKTYYNSYLYRWCNEKGGNCITKRFGSNESRTGDQEWQEFMENVAINGHPNNIEKKVIDYGNLQRFQHPEPDGKSAHFFRQQAEIMGFEVIDINNLEFREKQKPAVIEKIRPNPKKVEKVEPIEIEPIKEVAKYSPLMIAGVIAIVVILLLKRRRA